MLLSRTRVLVSTAAALALAVAPVVGAAPASAATSSTTYVAPGGADGTGCGTSTSPCLTVTKGAAQALASGADDMTLQIAAGTYHEKVVVASVPTGRVLHLVGDGQATTTIDAQQTGIVLYLSGTTGAFTVDGLTLTGGASSNYGGGIAFGSDLTVTDSTITGNHAANFGGGIASYGTLRLVRATVTGNTAVSYGGGVSAQSKTMTITDSTVSGNTAPFGAGVYNLASTTLTRSTVSGNTGTSAVTSGSGVYSYNGTLVVDDSTVAANLGTGPVLVGGGTAAISGSTISSAGSNALLTHSGTANTTVSGSVLSGGSAVCAGAFTDGGHNVTSDTSCGWGTGNGSNVSTVAGIGLQSLAANGSSGPKTMAIDASSSAHLLVPAADCSATDERGESRPGGGSAAPQCDAGAYELQYTPLTAIYVSPDGADTGGCGAETSPCLTVQNGIDQARFSPSDDVTVHVAAGTYAETVDAGTWAAGRSLTLEGAGASSTTIDAQRAGSVLRVAGGAVRVEGLTLTGGGGSTYGGGIDDDGDLTVVDSVITANASSGGGGGIYADQGSVTVSRSTISDNTSVDGGGAIAVDGAATLSVTASTMSGNTSNLGAAIYAGGPQTTVAGSTLSGNDGYGAVFVKAASSAQITDSTLYVQSGGPVVAAWDGTSAVTLARSVLSDEGTLACNGATFTDGGANVVSDDSCGFDESNGSVASTADAIALKPLAANGSDGPKTMAIGAASSAHLVVPAADCAATDERGQQRPGGGAASSFCDAGAYELQLNALPTVYVDGDGADTAACGPEADPCKTVQHGIEQARLSTTTDITVHIARGTYTETVDIGTWPAGRSLTLDGAGASSTTIDANRAGTVLSLRGGSVVASGLTLTGGQDVGSAGGVATSGDLELDRVEIVDNTSDAGGGVYASGGRLTINRSTIADNTGDQAGGGGVFVAPGAVVSIDRTTMTGNAGPGAAILNDGGTVTVSSSTLADNGTGAVALIGGGTTTVESSILSGSGCDVPVTDGGHNVTSDDSCGFGTAGGSVVSSAADIGLAPLGDFGGPTRTMPPRSFSPAAWPSDNRVPAGEAGCPASTGVDQRGVARPKDGGCDVGAVELAPTSLQAVLVGGQLTATAAPATGTPANLPAPVGAVTFATPMHTLLGCEQVPVDASGHMACTPDDAPVGTLSATFESSNGFAVSRDTVSGIATIAVAPGSGSVATGGSTSYTVTGFDGNGASLGDVTSYAAFTISPDGACRGDVCTPANAGTHTVTADVDGLTATATLVATQAGTPTSGPTPPASGPTSGGTPPTAGGPAVSPSALPRTGAAVELVPAVWLGLTLLLAGVVLTVAARRQRRA